MLIDVKSTIVIDFRDVLLPEGMETKEWIPTNLVPCILALGTGDFVVHITLPRLLGAHFVPGWDALSNNNIRAWGTAVPEHATLSTLFRITHVTIGGQAVAASMGTVAKRPPSTLRIPKPTEEPPKLIAACAGLSQTAMVAHAR